MKLIQAHQEAFTFHLDRKEKLLLFQVLRLYPAIPIAHHRLSKAEERSEDQELLREAVASQRSGNKKLVQALLKSKARFREIQDGFSFTIKASQMEWLLQVLNDVRVGSWLALGSPDGPQAIYQALNERTAPHFWAMEMAGHFQMALLAPLAG